MAKVLTEQEVAAIGANGASYTTNLCCTAGRADTLNCNVTSPSGAAYNLLITGVSKKAAAITVTGHSLLVYTNPLSTKIPGSGGTSEALVVTVTYYTTYSDGTSSSTNVTSSATILYNTTSTDSEPSTWYNYPSYGTITVGLNPYTYDITVGYGWAKATYNGYSDTDRSTINLEGYTSSGPSETGHYLKTYTYPLSHISGSGGTSAVPSFYVYYYTTYDNGTEDYVDVTNSATIKYNKTDTDSEPSTWYNDSSYCQFSPGVNSSSSTVKVGYAWVKAWYNGYSKADRSTVYQDGYTAPVSNDFIFHWDTSNASGKTTPVLLFYRSGDTTSSGTAYSSGRYGGLGSTNSGDVNANWNKTGTISKVYFIENGSSLKKVQINGYNGTTYLSKQNFSTYTMYTLTRSFKTSDYTSGTLRIYAYYYDS